ncbi:hypothetical protein [Bacillus cereus]|nr:hypothetical protein [Bacillus cereus]
MNARIVLLDRWWNNKNAARLLKGFIPLARECHQIGDIPIRANKEPLVTITLEDIDVMPMVHYKGEQIDRKVRVSFDWVTNTDKLTEGTYIHIEHVPSDNKRCNTKVIQHNHPIVKEEMEFYYGDGRLQSKTTT